jgi:Ca2+/Na+ antiporter
VTSTLVAAESDRALGAVGLVLAAVFWPVGIAVSIVAIIRSRRSGRVSRAAILGLVIGVFAFLSTVALASVIVTGLGSLADRCAPLGPGEYVFDDGSSLSCS